MVLDHGGSNNSPGKVYKFLSLKPFIYAFYAFFPFVRPEHLTQPTFLKLKLTKRSRKVLDRYPEIVLLDENSFDIFKFISILLYCNFIFLLYCIFYKKKKKFFKNNTSSYRIGV